MQAATGAVRAQGKACVTLTLAAASVKLATPGRTVRSAAPGCTCPPRSRCIRAPAAVRVCPMERVDATPATSRPIVVKCVLVVPSHRAMDTARAMQTQGSARAPMAASATHANTYVQEGAQPLVTPTEAANPTARASAIRTQATVTGPRRPVVPRASSASVVATARSSARLMPSFQRTQSTANVLLATQDQLARFGALVWRKGIYAPVMGRAAKATVEMGSASAKQTTTAPIVQPSAASPPVARILV